jgi:predicted dinucleotide-binding enzyme
MNIGVIGTGNIGEVIIRKLRNAGYPVKVANASGPESLKDCQWRFLRADKPHQQKSSFEVPAVRGRDRQRRSCATVSNTPYRHAGADL